MAQHTSVENGTVTLADFKFVDGFPQPKVNGNPMLYFSLDINREAIANILVKAGRSRDSADFGQEVARAHRYAQHLAAEYLNDEVAEAFRAYGDLSKYVVIDPDIVLPLLELADKSDVQVDESRAGHFENRRDLIRGSFIKAPKSLQALSDNLAAAIQLGVEEYAKNPEAAVAEAESRFGLVPGQGKLFTAMHGSSPARPVRS